MMSNRPWLLTAIFVFLSSLSQNGFINAFAPAKTHRAITARPFRTLKRESPSPLTTRTPSPGSAGSSLAITITGEGSETIEAFTDTVDFLQFDGPVRIAFVAAGVVAVILVGLKAFVERMDSAVEKVLVEFEKTVRSEYPRRWEGMARDLEGLDDTRRSVKIMNIMEALEKEDPEFMAKVNKKMAR